HSGQEAADPADELLSPPSASDSAGGSGSSDGSGGVGSQLATAAAEASRRLADATPGQQAMIGGAGGCLTGYLVGRVGRTAALVLGGGIICLQIAQQRGVVTVNWTRLNQLGRQFVQEAEVAAAAGAMGGGGARGGGGLLDRARHFLAGPNACFGTTFVGGFFIGLAFA
ncbi:hypothetical protein BOX15_Mlig034493g2, partial [Macrostomum lignano]